MFPSGTGSFPGNFPAFRGGKPLGSGGAALKTTSGSAFGPGGVRFGTRASGIGRIAHHAEGPLVRVSLFRHARKSITVSLACSELAI
jgi:hypothetical protein